MATFGWFCLIGAFAASLAGVAGLAAGRGGASPATMAGRWGVLASTTCLAVACGILVYCFMSDDVSILYVLEERSLSTSDIAWLYKLSGLWAGRSGSLLFWAFLIGAFNVAVLVRSRGVPARTAKLDNMAIMVAQIVVAVFVGVLLFAEGSMPFTPTPERLFAADGSLTMAASQYSMNQLLEHWAMAIHPPTLFIGYAGMTIPFGYAVAAIVANDSSALWVERSTRFLLVSWLFLGIGIGLGAVWAYVVLGWGGYWGWDPVENASLLPWLIGVALIHTFTVYRQRGAFKRWALICAGLAFTYVIVATFITRSGVVQSVHAFVGDPVSLVLFSSLIVLSLAVTVIGVAVRWKSFGPDTEGADDVDSLMSREAAYYFNNVIMVVFTVLLTYMTVSSALPEWLPFGGSSLATTAYDAVARPLGIIYLFIMAVGPLFGWGMTDRKKFLRQARVPALCALVLFVGLLAYWLTNLRPAYFAMLERGTSASMTLYEAGPPAYYNGLAVVGLLVASLLFFNALYLLVRGLKAKSKRASVIGGMLTHMGMGIILVGLIGSAMYVTEETGYMSYDAATDVAAHDFTIQEYRLVYAGQYIVDMSEESNTVLYGVDFDVYRDGAFVGQAHPQVQLSTVTQQQKLNASVLSFVDEDLFIVYRGVNTAGAFSLDVRVNPLINFVWFGFAVLVAGTIIAVVGRRGRQTRSTLQEHAEANEAQIEPGGALQEATP